MSKSKIPASRIVALSGRMGSGKTTAAFLLACRLAWLHVSFGDYVRDIANLREVSPTRRNLQEIGMQLTDGGMERFCREVLKHSGWRPGFSAVVDGIRHVSAVEAIRDLVRPTGVLHVHLEAPEGVRQDRLRRRGDSTFRIDGLHPVEAEVSALLPRAADVVISTDRSESDLVQCLADLATIGETSVGDIRIRKSQTTLP